MKREDCRLIVALDFDRLGRAIELAKDVAGIAGMFKIGSRLFTAEGPDAVRELAKLGPGIFLDLKFHDIPNTVAGAVSAAASLPGIRLMNLHTLGGFRMMRAAVGALAAGEKRARPRLLGVTILTSLDAEAMGKVGISGRPKTRAVQLARLARKAGLDGVVASAHEVAAIRRACAASFLIVVPGVRPGGLGAATPGFRRAGDQARVATPAEAIRAGADYVVVGRPITEARDPRAAAAAIAQEMAQAQRRRI